MTGSSRSSRAPRPSTSCCVWSSSNRRPPQNGGMTVGPAKQKDDRSPGRAARGTMNEESLRAKPLLNGSEMVPLVGRRRRPLGELLLEEGLISPEQLGQALEIQRSTGKRP